MLLLPHPLTDDILAYIPIIFDSAYGDRTRPRRPPKLPFPPQFVTTTKEYGGSGHLALARSRRRGQQSKRQTVISSRSRTPRHRRSSRVAAASGSLNARRSFLPAAYPADPHHNSETSPKTHFCRSSPFLSDVDASLTTAVDGGRFL